jgi:hypothetical protein
MGETLNGNIDTSSTGGFTPGWPFPATGVLTAGGPMPAKVTDPKADLSGTPKNVPQPIFNQDPVIPGRGQPIVVTKNLDGSTRTVSGTVAGVTITNPA